MAYFILSLDGGGIRGIMTAKLLERLEQNPKELLQQELKRS
jgi:patatin-like phospholipase/acyl hydrolase